MKIVIKNTLKLFTFLLCLMPALVWAADYTVNARTLTVDGNTFCGGGACTSSDTIIIAGGARGSIWFKNFNGNGSYIPIVNQNVNPDSRVEITASTQSACIIEDCKYVDFKGNNDADLTYGIKVINDGSPENVNTVRVTGQSDHIKISYLEIAFTGNTSNIGNGIFIQDASLSSSWIWDTIEIHHNYIHGSRYAGMYLGQNNPGINDDPYISNVSVHDNIIDDSGAYGMTLKGVSASSGPCAIYNNTIRVTGLVYTEYDGSYKSGISAHMFSGRAYANIYNNRIEHTAGVGIRAGTSNHQIYDNEVLGCGTSGDGQWASGILLFEGADSVDVYDNIIIQPTGHGIFANSNTSNCTDSRNLIGDAGSGERYDQSGGMTEGTGDNANIYYANVADFNFVVWSDNANYTDDIFTSGYLLPPVGLRIVSR